MDAVDTKVSLPLTYLTLYYLLFLSPPIGLAGIRYAHDGQGHIQNGFLRQKKGNGDRPSETGDGRCEGKSKGDSSKRSTTFITFILCMDLFLLKVRRYRLYER